LKEQEEKENEEFKYSDEEEEVDDSVPVQFEIKKKTN